MIRCLFCGKGPHDGVSLHRVNAIGEIGVWACERHIKQTDAAPIDPFVKKLADVCEGKTSR
jgi:hypothetical protein